MLENENIKFKTTLVFWKLYDSFLNFSQEELKKLLKESDNYGGRVMENYIF